MPSPPTGRLTFADLTAPIEPADFFAKHWTREGVHLRRAGRAFDDYLSWDAVSTILNAGDIAFPKIKVSRRDRPVPPEEFTTKTGGAALVDGQAVLGLFRDGASFGITGADSHWDALRSVVDCLYDTLLESVHTNVYCSPADTQGFQCHYDLHEVFVLQVDGEKHWRVYRPTSEAPVTGWNADDAPHQTREPYIDVVLAPGDVLYVPRGHWHYAVASGSASLHVTVGVTCRKGDAFLDWLANELFHEAAWRRNLPLLATATASGEFAMPAGFTDWSRDVTASLTAKLADPELFERFCKDTLASIPPIHNGSVPEGTIALDAARFSRPAGRRHYFHANSDGSAGVIVSIAGAEIELDVADDPLVRRILDAESFTMADIRAWKPDQASDDVTDLLTELTRAGFLRVERQ